VSVDLLYAHWPVVRKARLVKACHGGSVGSARSVLSRLLWQSWPPGKAVQLAKAENTHAEDPDAGPFDSSAGHQKAMRGLLPEHT